jgi:hypothetical protein
MTPAQEIRIGVVLEGPSDHRTVCGLVDRLMVEDVGWIQDLSDRLKDIRSFIGSQEPSSFLAWKDVAREARGRVPPRHGHFAGEPGFEDAHHAVLALRLFTALATPPLGVVLVRDSDGRPKERLKGLQQARDDGRWPFRVVLGIAHFMRETWVLAGFIPASVEEEDRLDQERQNLGFHPNREPHRLDAKDKAAPKSAKRVLEALTGSLEEREEPCWQETPLETLRICGAAAGLDAFLSEIEEHIVPALR